MTFDEIAQRLDGALGRANTMPDRERREPSEQLELSAESAEEFSAALEQLQVIDEEMRRQNDELIATRAAMEAERLRYQELFELAPGGYVVTDSAGTIREANQAAKILLGVKTNKLEGKPLVVFVEQDDRRDFRVRLAAMQRADEPQEWEIRLRPSRGDRIAAAVKCVPAFDEQGKLSALRWLLRDITERKRAEEAVFDSERRLRKQTWALRRLASCHRRNLDDLDAVLKEITETAADALELERTSIWLFNEDCSLIRCADLFELTSRTHSSGFELEAARHPRYFKALEVQRAIAARDACGDPRTAEFAEGYFLRLGITSVLDAPIRLGGKLVGVIWHEHVGAERRWTLDEENFAGSIAESVSLILEAREHRRSEEALRAGEERYRVFVEQSSEAIWRFELDEPMALDASEEEKIEHAYRHAYLAECNDVMARMYGLSSASQIVGSRLSELLDRSDARNIDYLRSFFRSGYRVADAESHEVDAAGQKRYFLNNLVGVLDEGRLVRAWGTQRDITDQRHTEEEIHERNRQLAALNATSAAVSGSLELSSVLATLKKLLMEQMEIPSGGIYLYDEADDLFYLQAVWGLPDQIVSKLRTYPATAFYGDQMTLQPDAILSVEFGESSSFPLAVEEGEEKQWQSYLRVPLIAKGQIQGIAALIGAKAGLLSAEQVSFFKALGQQVGVAIQNARLFEQVSAARERMRTLSQRLVQVQEAERRHIARELHDQVGQALTGLIFELEVCRRLPPPDQDKRITRAQELANELIAQVRNLSLVLRPTILDDLGLLPALLWHFERYTDSTGVRVSFDYTGLERRFPAEVETAAYRVAQEALTNVARHAEVREATVHVWADLEMLCVQVEDRGAGFDAKAASEKHTSSGVAGMRERALLLGGELNIESSPGGGARLTAEFPLHGIGANDTSSLVSR